jgi:hypothetical protein
MGGLPDVWAPLPEESGSRRQPPRGKTMIDWDSDTWGNGVTYAANGSWVTDKHGSDDTDQG